MPTFCAYGMDALNKACAVTSAVEHGVAAAMEKWGRLVARHPAKVFAGSLVFALVCISGFARIRSETETENLWTPIGAPVIKDKDLYSEMFGSGFRIHTIFFKDKKDDIKKAFRAMAQKFHPDVVGAAASDAERKAAEARFKEASGAYEVLGDVLKRREYDRVQDAGPAHGRQPGFRTGSAQPRYPQWSPQAQAAMRPKVPLSKQLGRASLMTALVGTPLLLLFTFVGGITDSVWEHFNQGKALKRVADDRARRSAAKAARDSSARSW